MILHDKTIRSNLSESECHEEILSNKDIEKIWKLAFSGGNVRKNKLGNIFINGDVVNQAYNVVRDKILVRGKLYGGNFFIASHPYGLHLDSFNSVDVKDDNTTVYKNVLIPLWIGSSDFGDYLTFFEQRLIDYGSAFNCGGSTSYKESKYQVHNDYSSLQFVDRNGKNIDKKYNSLPFKQYDKDKYLQNLEYTRLTGMTIENAFEWKPQDIIIFDSVQIHASNRTQWSNKMGLLLKFGVDI